MRWLIFMMYFKLLYLTSDFNHDMAETQTFVLKNATMETPRFVFDHITLGSSGILISWNASTKLNIWFTFEVRIKNSKNDYVSFPYAIYNSNVGHYAIHSLKENTFYEVIIKQYPKEKDRNKLLPPEIEYLLTLRTNWKTNTKPVKPDFQWYFTDRTYPISVYIKGFPCGIERNCHGNEAGNYFAVEIRSLDRRGEYRFTVSKVLATEIYFLIPTIPYEIVFISINGDHETESDPQEIFIKPVMSAVTSIKIISYPNASVLVSWKPPRSAFKPIESLNYSVSIMNNSFAAKNSFSCFFTNNSHSSNNTKFINEMRRKLITNRTEKLFDKSEYQLKLGDSYIFSIIPFQLANYGMETRVKYTIPVNKDD